MGKLVEMTFNAAGGGVGYAIPLRDQDDKPASVGFISIFTRGECYVGLRTVADPAQPGATPAPNAGASAKGWTHLLANEEYTIDVLDGLMAGDPQSPALKIKSVVVWSVGAGDLLIKGS